MDGIGLKSPHFFSLGVTNGGDSHDVWKPIYLSYFATLMHPEGKVFLKSTTVRLGEVLAVLSPEDQHDLLDALAGEIEIRLEELIEGEN